MFTGIPLGIGTGCLAAGGARLPATASAATAATSPDLQDAQRAVVMFGLVLLVIGVFLLAALIVLVARRIRRRQQQSPPRAPAAMPDPWSESGKRIQP